MKKELLHTFSFHVAAISQNHWTCFHGGCMSVFCLHLHCHLFYCRWTFNKQTCMQVLLSYMPEQSRLIWSMLPNLTVVWLFSLAIILICVMKCLNCFQIMFLPTVALPHSTSVKSIWRRRIKKGSWTSLTSLLSYRLSLQLLLLTCLSSNNYRCTYQVVDVRPGQHIV